MMQSFLESGRSRGRAARRGYTLVEALVVMVIMSVLVAMGIPRFQQSLEQSRADVAGANLQVDLVGPAALLAAIPHLRAGPARRSSPRI